MRRLLALFALALVALGGAPTEVRAQDPAVPGLDCATITDAVGCVYAQCFWNPAGTPKCEAGRGCAVYSDNQINCGFASGCFWRNDGLGHTGCTQTSGGCTDSTLDTCMMDSASKPMLSATGCKLFYDLSTINEGGVATVQGCAKGGCAGLSFGECTSQYGACEWFDDYCRQVKADESGTAVTAIVCSDHGASEWACYADKNCHFDSDTQLCGDGPPGSTCSFYYRDTTGCVAAGCSVGADGVCVETTTTAPGSVTCASHGTDVTACNNDPSCFVNGWSGVCMNKTTQAPASATCAAQATPEQCHTAKCVFDLYAPAPDLNGRCYESLAEEFALFGSTCDAWSHYPTDGTNAMACSSARGCGLTADNRCVDQNSPEATPPTPTNPVPQVFDFAMELVNARVVTANGLPRFEAAWKYPLAQGFNPYDPQLVAYGFGAGPDKTQPVQPSACNNLETGWPHPAFYIGEPKMDPPYSNVNYLYSEYPWPQAMWLMQPADFQAAMFDIVGRQKSEEVDPVIRREVTNGDILQYFGMPLDTIVTQCGGNRTTIDRDLTEYEVDLWVMVRRGDLQEKVPFKRTLRLGTDSSASIGYTGANKCTVRHASGFGDGDPAGPTNDPPGSKRREYSVFITCETAGANTLIGAAVPEPFKNAYGDVINGYGARVVDVVLPTGPLPHCVGSSGPYCATTRIDFVTAGVVPTVDGQALNYLDYQGAAVRQQVTGSTTGEIDPVLGYDYSFYARLYQYSAGQQPTDGQLVSQTAHGDLIQLSFMSTIMPDVEAIAARLPDPICGILTTPTGTLASDVRVPTANISGTLVDLRNEQAMNNYLFCAVCYYENVDLRTSIELHMKTDLLYFVALDATGNPIPGTDPLPFADVRAKLTHVPRSMIGQHVSAAYDGGVKGADAFCLSPVVLRDKLKAPGTASHLFMYAKLPDVVRGDESVTPHGRRLLQASDPGTPTVTTNTVVSDNITVTVSVMLPDMESTPLVVNHLHQTVTKEDSEWVVISLAALLCTFAAVAGLALCYADRKSKGERQSQQKDEVKASMLRGRAKHRSDYDGEDDGRRGRSSTRAPSSSGRSRSASRSGY